MSRVSSTEANRSFSKMLSQAIDGRVTDVTVRGKLVARLIPVSEQEAEREEKFLKHLEELRKRPVLNLPRMSRDELYEDT